MNRPGPSELLAAWEEALPLPPADRPLALLAVLDRPAPERGWEHLPVGRRDDRLLTVWEDAFGPELSCLAQCPRCHEPVEFDVPAAHIRLPAPTVDAPLSLERGGCRVTFRLPDTTDLAACAGERELAMARRLILERCVISATGPDGGASAASELPEDLIAEVAQRMGEADPQADVAFALACPQCGHQWQAPFDIAAHLWAQLEAWVRRQLAEVHRLATAYGWSESEILKLSAARRQAYLELIGP